MQNASAYVRELFAGKANTVADALSRQFEDDQSILLAVSSPIPALMYFKTRLVVPPILHLRQQLLHEFHSTPTSGHSGLKASLARLAASFFCSKEGMGRNIHGLCHPLAYVLGALYSLGHM